MIFASSGKSKQPKVPHWILHLGVAGVFGVALLDASPIPVPIPGSADLLILIFAANHENPILLVAAGVIGSTIGAYLTWAAGKKGGEAVLDKSVPKRMRSRVDRWSKKYGAFSVFLAALAPPPLPTLPFLLASGALGTRARSVVIAFLIARVLRFSLDGYLGSHYGKQILKLWAKYQSSTAVHVLLWTIVALIVGTIAFGIYKVVKARRQRGSSGSKDKPAA